jgi:hypothetical protein
MHVYDDKIVAALQAEMGKEPIYHIGLGAFDFQFAFGNLVRVQNMLRVDFCLNDVEYTWKNGPTSIPVWLLIGQVPSAATLESATALKIRFIGGDWLRLHTDEGPYESQIFEWSRATESPIPMGIY